jgi:uncharacterized DUF497 family protein
VKHRIVAGFDWDAGNREKCQKHGVSVRDIEGLFARTIAIQPDPSVIEQRFRAIGRTEGGRYVFLVFTLRKRKDDTLIRPISARYMHSKEITLYEEKNPDIH